jgi:hypothetical protein
MITHIQNLVLFTISLSSFTIYLYHNLFNLPINYYNIQKGICLYSLVDLFFTKSKVSKLHHLLTIGVVYYCFYYDVNFIDCNELTCFYLKTESTSIFLVLKNYINKNSIAYKINILIFYLLFFKIRILDNYNAVVSSGSLLFPIIQKYSSNNIYNSSIIFVSCYGLYIINIYWFGLISHLMYKEITSHITKNKIKN